MSDFGFIDTPFGTLSVQHYQDSVISTQWVLSNKEHATSNHPTILALKKEIGKYCCDPNYRITFKTKISGTTFQRAVWKKLCDISAGTTLSYGELSKILKSSPRAIGQACKKNPLPLIVPCHRVVSKDSIGGFMGAKTGTAINLKLSLLNYERNFT